jgi:hypothetical protein
MPLILSPITSMTGCFLFCVQGAVYVTGNGAYTWTAAVQETVDATLNRTVSSGLLHTKTLRVIADYVHQQRESSAISRGILASTS